jgi:superfamily I DNA and RNA helicase
MKFLALALALFSSLSCGSFKERTQERELQSKMIRALNEKTPQFASCAKEHDLFERLKEERIRVELILDINSKGQVDRFQIDNQDYPNSFVDCMFKIADMISFPELKRGEVVHLTQPFIFTR